MGVIFKSVLFLLRRGPEIFETGKLITRTLAAVPALTEAGAAHVDGGDAARVDGIERELRTLLDERHLLSQEVERLSREVGTLRAEAEKTGRRMMGLMLLFSAFLGAGLVLAAVILARFP